LAREDLTTSSILNCHWQDVLGCIHHLRRDRLTGWISLVVATCECALASSIPFDDFVATANNYCPRHPAASGIGDYLVTDCAVRGTELVKHWDGLVQSFRLFSTRGNWLLSDEQLWECTISLCMTKPIYSFRAQLPVWLGGSVDLHNCHLRCCRISCAVVMFAGWHSLCTSALKLRMQQL
jgi:hypothetical protein